MPNPMPPRPCTLTDHDERHTMLAREPAYRSNHVRAFELDDLRSHGLRHLNILDQPALYRCIDTVGPLVWGLHIYAVPIRVQASRDPACLAQEDRRTRRIARHGHENPIGSPGRRRLAGTPFLAAHDTLSCSID